jgi:hypothetical protein
MSGYARRPVKDGNPNLALVILLIVFVLTSIGLGVWGYYGYEQQEDLKNAASKKSQEAAALRNAKDFYAAVAMEMKLIISGKLTEEEKGVWAVSRSELFKEKGGKFDDQKNRIDYLEVISEAINNDGLVWDEKEDKYSQTWKQKVEPLTTDIDKLKGDLKTKDDVIAGLMKRETNLIAQSDALKRDMENKEKEHQKALTAEKNAQFAALIDQSKKNSELTNEIVLANERASEREVKWFDEKEAMERELVRLASNVGPKEAATKPVVKSQNQGVVNPQFLTLDISMGKPLWDVPVGKVLSVIQDKVLIQIEGGDGIEERLKTKLTFNVFANAGGKADGTLKGTIEVIKLEGGRTAVCRINSRYSDKDKDNPIVEGDLLFNLVWGTHVVVAGQVNLFGKYRGESQLEQVSNLKHFLNKLEDQGVIVDAYIDLTDGSLKGKYGAITTKTRFVIRGDTLDERKGIQAALAAAPEGNDDVKNDELRAVTKERIKDMNKKIESLVDEAVRAGAFVISAENFANVAGYRKLGGYGPDDAAPFQPRLPAGN